ncbi:hypothetical protein M8C21_017661, partial [Ambrosia artemisiifolia]
SVRFEHNRLQNQLRVIIFSLIVILQFPFGFGVEFKKLVFLRKSGLMGEQIIIKKIKNHSA